MLQVFPGEGLPDLTRNFTGGLANLTALVGQYLDNLAGLGGTGSNRVNGA